VIDGEHDTEAEDFKALTHELIPVFVLEDGLVGIEDPELKAQILQLTIPYLYMHEGDIVTSEHQMIPIDEEQYELDIPHYGTVPITPVGVIEVQEHEAVDCYQLAVANPVPGTYLVIILEIIGINPLEFRAINVEDMDLVDGIIQEYLVQIGAIDPEGENDENEEAWEEPVNDAETLADDTVVPGQYWSMTFTDPDGA
jgi:hypothetical protein